MTTSSLGLLRHTWEGSVTGQFGEALTIRSDEWLTAAPLELATLANGSSMTSPLAHGPDLIYQLSSGSPIESLLFLEGNLLRLGAWLPDAMLFAAFRGYHWLLLALFLPPLLRRLGANRPMSWLAVVLCFLAPAAIWWSFMPIRILCFAVTGCYLLLLAVERLERRHLVRGLLLAALAGLMLARLVTYYVPWSLTVGVPLVIATGVFLIRERSGRRPALLAIGFGAAVSLFLLIGTFWENLGALRAELSTAYPGIRRASGSSQDFYDLFGAPGLFEIERFPELAGGTSQSEISSAYLICLLVAVMVWPAASGRLSAREKGAVVTLAAFTANFSAWVMFDWGPIGELVPGLNLLTPERAVQTVGFPAAILMCLVLSAWARVPEHATVSHDATATVPWTAATARTAMRSRALLVGAVVLVVTGFAVSDLQRAVPELPVWQIWLSTAVTGGLAWAWVRYPARAAPVVVALVVSCLAQLDANPVMFGLGQVRTSPAADHARAFRAQEVADGTRMVTDTMHANALLIANGVPLLSGYQVTGPVREQWAIVDPESRYEGIWNRGASYLLFSFDRSPGADPVVVEENPDVIRVQTDPCWLAASPFAVTRIVSQVGVKSPCARKTDVSFVWNGAPQQVYEISER